MTELHHISDSDFGRYHLDAIRGPELVMIEEHLFWCLDCVHREREICAASERKGLVRMDHISTDDLERYHLDLITEAPTIAEIEQHLSECQECADRKLALERFINLVETGVIRDARKSYGFFLRRCQNRRNLSSDS